MSFEIPYPDIFVQLSGTDGNAYALIGAVRRALQEAGHGDEVREFIVEATAGDYMDLLATCMRWVDCG
jgi:hypothetical protein